MTNNGGMLARAVNDMRKAGLALKSRLSTIEAETIERCARKVEGFANDPLKSWILDVGAAGYVAAAIRKLAQEERHAKAE